MPPSELPSVRTPAAKQPVKLPTNHLPRNDLPVLISSLQKVHARREGAKVNADAFQQAVVTKDQLTKSIEDTDIE